jgi:hypothetical protein
MNKTSALFPLVALALAACGSGSTSDGIEAQIGAVAHRHDGGAAHSASAKHSTSNYKTFRREDGMRIDLQRGLLSPSAVALEPCGPSIARLGRQLLDFVLPAAQAHGGHVGEAAGVVDVVGAPDLTRFELGMLSAAPGDYCGLVVELLPVPIETEDHGVHSKSTEPDRALFVSPCYYPNTVGVAELPQQLDETNAALFAHSCIEAGYSGPVLRKTLAFTQSVRLDGSSRSFEVMVGTTYDRWFEGIAMDRLADDPDEQARLMQQVLQTLQLHGMH